MHLIARVVSRFLGAAAITPEKLNDLLLKVRKKAVASFNWKNVADVVTHLGGKVEKVVGLVPIEKEYFVGKTEEEAIAKHSEMEKFVVNSLPSNPKQGQLYLTKLTPVALSRHKDWEFDYEGAAGNEGWQITMPNGKTFSALPSKYDIGNAHHGWKVIPATKVSIYDAISWLTKEGDWVDLANKALSMEAIEPTIPRTREKTGSCGVCFQNVKIKLGDPPRIVLHGYKRPGTGQVHGNCFGMGYPPFELSAEATQAFNLQVLIPLRDRTADRLRALKAGEVTELTVGFGTRTIKVGDPLWDHELKGAISQTERNLTAAEEEVQTFKDLVSHWKERPLPKEGEPHIDWYYKGRKASRQDLVSRVAARYMEASYFSIGDIVLYGKYKNHHGKVVAFGADKWGNPTIEIEPIPKGRKQNKILGLFKIWRADVKENALAEQARVLGLPSKDIVTAKRVVSRFLAANAGPDEDE